METPAGEHVRFTAEARGKLLDQPRLAETCLSDHGDGHGHPLTGGAGVYGLQAAHLFAAPHQRHVETDWQGTQSGVRGPQQEPVRAGVLGLDGPGGELPGLVAEEDLARPGGRREQRRPGAHVPGEPERARTPDQRLARRQPETVLQAGAEMARQRARLRGQRLPRLQAGPHRPQGIILVQGGDTEDAHQVFAIGGRQPSAVPLERGRQAGGHVLGHHAVCLGVQLRA